jgi:hypothetical protein
MLRNCASVWYIYKISINPSTANLEYNCRKSQASSHTVSTILNSYDENVTFFNPSIANHDYTPSTPSRKLRINTQKDVPQLRHCQTRVDSYNAPINQLHWWKQCIIVPRDEMFINAFSAIPEYNRTMLRTPAYRLKKCLKLSLQTPSILVECFKNAPTLWRKLCISIPQHDAIINTSTDNPEYTRFASLYFIFIMSIHTPLLTNECLFVVFWVVTLCTYVAGISIFGKTMQPPYS